MYNKTDCTATVAVNCSNSATLGTAIPANDFADMTCPTGAYACEVEVNLPGGAFGLPEVDTINPFVLCSGSGGVNQNNVQCNFTGNSVWSNVAGIHYALNVY